MERNSKPNLEKHIPHFLADTWWYGMTKRISDQEFRKLVGLRKKQGFTAAQIVVGIPPEIGPENGNAVGINEPAWDMNGSFSQEYLRQAVDRISYMNSHGLLAIVYGAWGHQIEWLGVDGMKEWWGEIISATKSLDAFYCVTGESNLWTGEENKLLPDKSTDNLLLRAGDIPPIFTRIGKRILTSLTRTLYKTKREERGKKWGEILAHVAGLTDKPIIIHTLPGEFGSEVTNRGELLSAETVQTGHDSSQASNIWKLPTRSQKPFINLEPWYEGIQNDFGLEDQIYAYWASVMAGVTAVCYGAQGVWNVGDGKFLGHWGRQTYDQALSSKTPELLGKSHALALDKEIFGLSDTKVKEKKGELLWISRASGRKGVTYYPEISRVRNIQADEYFVPTKGEFARQKPKSGQVVVCSEV